MYKLSTNWLVGLVALLISVTALADTEVTTKAVAGSAKADKLNACVAPTSLMRRSHFELIKHQRDITVHQGIRKTDHSLAGCIDCHAAKDAQDRFVPVNVPGQFCAGCHQYTGVTLDCFSCHATTPTTANQYD